MCTVLGYMKSKFLQIWKIHFRMPARKCITSNYMSFFFFFFLSKPTHIEIMREKT